MKQLFNQIEVEVESNPDGWASVRKAQTLACTVLSLRPALIVEIGVWAGRSLIPMTMALKFLGEGKIIGIDPWNMQASTEDMTGQHLKWWSEVDHEMIFQRFTKRLQASGAAMYCDIRRCRSDEYKVEGAIDLLHLDGNHGEKASTYEVENYASKVRIGGLMFMDDIFWATKATQMLSDYGFRELYKLDTGAMLQRVKR